jgi:hypothetical protein
MANIKVKPPWEMTTRQREEYASSGWKKQQDIIDQVKREKKKHTQSGKWANWERGRKKALSERRDYFRKHPEKRDDFSGV